MPDDDTTPVSAPPHETDSETSVPVSVEIAFEGHTYAQPQVRAAQEEIIRPESPFWRWSHLTPILSPLGLTTRRYPSPWVPVTLSCVTITIIVIGIYHLVYVQTFLSLFKKIGYGIVFFLSLGPTAGVLSVETHHYLCPSGDSSAALYELRTDYWMGAAGAVLTASSFSVLQIFKSKT
ncbi:hypothetical protein EV421DRAFT_1896329 [Armillaria borealis]|uniref:Uncharacterized protein n=1 Tax=Armillaria borealis TaxID=47425 RepID=A0AA39K6V2_9AGAR|nr:hypothetical protein EV421DRAFT_1896329 [Armillaria borealis]